MKAILLNDFRAGTRKNVWKYLMLFLFTIIMCILFSQQVAKKVVSGRLQGGTAGISDFIFYMLGGMKKYVPSRNRDFDIPVIWMTVQMILCSCVFSYPVRNLHDAVGSAAVVRSGSRCRWWLGKCIWAVQQVLIAYICILAGCAVAAAITGNADMTLHPDIFRVTEGVSLVASADILLCCIIFPVIYNVMISLAQVNLSLLLNPILSMVIVMAYHVMSAYTMTPALLGNISMMYRNNLLTAAGISPASGAFASFIVIVFSILAGMNYFKRYDIM